MGTRISDKCLKFLVITVLVLVVAVNLILAADAVPRNEKQVAHFTEVFKRAIYLNEDFKKATTLEEQQLRRSKADQFDDDTLMPAYEECIKYLSENPDDSLTMSLFDLLVSYENSADEELAHDFGDLYYNNADLVERVLRKRGYAEQKYLIGELLWEWVARIPPADKKDIKVKNFSERLQGLSREIIGSDTADSEERGSVPQALYLIQLESNDWRLRYVTGCEIDLNGDFETDITMVVETSRGRELIVLIRTAEGYNAFVLSKVEPYMDISCRIGKTVTETKVFSEDGSSGKVFQTPGAYLQLSEPEGASVAYFWNGSGFSEVWIAD